MPNYLLFHQQHHKAQGKQSHKTGFWKH